LVDRRAFLVAAGAAVVASSVPQAVAQTPANAPGNSQAPATGAAPAAADGPYHLDPLPYAPEALEPAIDAETMRIHHGKHHAAYVKNLNAALVGLPALRSIDELLRSLDTIPEAKRMTVRNNGGGHANHTLFWSVLAPAGEGGEPTKELIAAIERDLGGLAKMNERLTNAAMSRFGSGWAWIFVNSDRVLEIGDTANQDSPLMTGVVARTGTPIFGIDVWEHAYYLKYQNRRADYVKAILGSIHWGEVSKRFTQAMGS
jgi:Fe-Mn family superoxide dismutase